MEALEVAIVTSLEPVTVDETMEVWTVVFTYVLVLVLILVEVL